MSRISLKALTKTYDNGYQATRGVDFEIDDGEFIVFVGPSGCGKSTLLRLIAGLEDITSGDLYFDDERVNDLAPAQRRVGMVFQSYALYPHMTVAENIGFGLKLAKVPAAERAERVQKAAKILQLESLLDTKPKAMSGGQRQRVAIGRAIVRNPRVFLFDEPLSNLDAALRVDMRLQIAKLHRELGATMIYVTHDQVEAMTLADRIVVLEAGKVRQIGKPMDLYDKPANTFVAGFIGSPKMNFLSVKASGTSDQGQAVTSPALNNWSLTAAGSFAPQTDGDALILGVRPEHLTLSKTEAGTAFAATVSAIERLGNDNYAYVDIAGSDDLLTVRCADLSSVDVGDPVWISADAARCHLFDAEGETIALPETQG